MHALVDALRAGRMTLDGGLGTLLESREHDLRSELWSADTLANDPEAIRDVHRDYFAAGAAIATTASYQLSYEGAARFGLGPSEVDELLLRSVALAARARDAADGDDERFVAASVGPYGAMLADGSEYRGDYGLSVAELRAWHRRRVRTLAATDADVLAIETLPCLAEVEAVAREVEQVEMPCWLSMTIADGALRSGEDLQQAFAIADSVENVIAVGVNCSHPRDVSGGIRAASSVTAKPIIVYPNSGEEWDALGRRWLGNADFPPALVQEWLAEGASGIGGCCRTGPSQIRAIAQAMVRVGR